MKSTTTVENQNTKNINKITIILNRDVYSDVTKIKEIRKKFASVEKKWTK